MGWLDNQVALVTGGGSGIGLGIVERFIGEGARVGVLDRDGGRLDQLKGRFGESLVGIQGDVSRLEVNKRAVQETAGDFGQLDIFVGNAGVFDLFQRLDDFPEDQLDSAFDELFAINVKGCIMGAKAAIPELEKSRGSMVFTASGAGLNSQGGGPLYTASKHAVVGLVRQLAVELAPSIRVNAVAPGGVLTDLRGLAAVGEDQRSQFSNPSTETRMQAGNPLGLAMNPEDLAGAYVFLSSRENARGVTGTILSVDAGSNLRWMRAT